MEWKPILEEPQCRVVSEKIKDLYFLLKQTDLSKNSPGLTHGNLGIALFLFYYWRWLLEDELYEDAGKLFSNSVMTIKPYLHTSERKLATIFSEKNVYSGLGWGITHLLTQGFIEGNPAKYFASTNALIFREIIDAVQDPSLKHLPMCIQTSLYCLNEGGRMSQEFLRRFIQELYIRHTDERIKEALLSMHPWTLSGFFLLLCKIADKYDDILYVHESVEWLETLLNAVVDGKYQLTVSDNWPETRLLISYGLLKSRISRPKAIDTLMQEGRRLASKVDDMKMEKGLSSGLCFNIHFFNCLYQQTCSSLFRHLALICYEKLMTKASYVVPDTSIKTWLTASNGTWGLQYGLANGISGIGLMLLSTISAQEPVWDEWLHFR